MCALCSDDSNGSYGNKDQQREKERDTGKAAGHFSKSLFTMAKLFSIKILSFLASLLSSTIFFFTLC